MNRTLQSISEGCRDFDFGGELQGRCRTGALEKEQKHSLNNQWSHRVFDNQNRSAQGSAVAPAGYTADEDESQD